MRGVLARGWTRPALETADAALAESAGDDRSGRGGAETLELVEAAAQGCLVVGVGQRERGLVEASEVGPELRRLFPLPGELQRIGPGHPFRHRLAQPRAPAPAEQFAGHPAGAVLNSEG